MTLIVGDEREREKRNQYWLMIHRAGEDFYQQGFTDDFGMFAHHLKQRYGVAIELIDRKITSNYYITDEKKYAIFLLKYGS